MMKPNKMASTLEKQNAFSKVTPARYQEEGPVPKPQRL